MDAQDDKLNKKIDILVYAHRAEMDSLREDLTARHHAQQEQLLAQSEAARQADVEKERAAVDSTLENMVQRHKAEMEALRAEHAFALAAATAVPAPTAPIAGVPSDIQAEQGILTATRSSTQPNLRRSLRASTAAEPVKKTSDLVKKQSEPTKKM